MVKRKAEYIEGRKARENFETAMKADRKANGSDTDTWLTICRA